MRDEQNGKLLGIVAVHVPLSVGGRYPIITINILFYGQSQKTIILVGWFERQLRSLNTLASCSAKDLWISEDRSRKLDVKLS